MTIDVKVNADTSGAIAALEALGAKVESIQKRFGDNFEKMSLAAAGLAASLLAAGHEAAAFADEISDLADANQLAIGEVLALSEALGQSGGKSENAAKALQTLSNKVDEANSGNIKLAGTFGKLGISISDLGNLSNTELRDKLLDNIAAIEDPMMRNAKAVEMFGKAMVGVDIRKFAEEQKKGREEQERFAPALRTAGDAFDRLGLIADRSKIAFAQAFEPLFKIISELNPSVDSLATKFRVMGAVLAVLTAGATVGAVLKLVDAFKLLGLVVARNPLIALASAALGVATYFGLGASEADKLAKATDDVGKSADKTTRSQEGLTDAIQKEKDKITKVGEELQKNFDIVNRKYDQELRNLSLNEDQKTIAEAIAKVEEDRLAARAKAEDAFKAQSVDVQALTKATLDAELAGIDTKSAKQKQAVEQEIQARLKLQTIIKDLNNFVNGTAENQKTIFELNARQAISTASNYQEQIVLEQKLAEVQKIRAAFQATTAGMSGKEQAYANGAISDGVDKINLLTDSYENINAKIQRTIQLQGLAGSQAGTEFNTDSVQKMLDASKGARQAAVEGARDIANANMVIVEQSRSFSAGWSKAFNDYVTNATNSAQIAQNIFNKFTQGLEDTFVNFVKTGKFEWKNFVASMAEELLRSSIKQNMAKIFSATGLGGIFGIGGTGGKSRGESITNPMYVQDVSKKTEDFIQSMKPASGQGAMESEGIFSKIQTTIEDFATGVGDFLSNMFSGFGSFIGNFTSSVGSILSSIGGSLFDIISSIGGTLFDVIGGLGSSLGDILGSIGGGGGGSGNFLSTAFDAITSFLGFASGGVIPSNAPVIVGEKGPELLFGSQGAAIVANGAMNSGSTHVVYNINAVDAMSFKQMIAADPSFLYAVTQQGAKSMPSRR